MASEILGERKEGGWCIDQYGEMIGQNSLIDSQLMKLRDIIEKEINVQQDVFAIMGMVDTIMENSQN